MVAMTMMVVMTVVIDGYCNSKRLRATRRADNAITITMIAPPPTEGGEVSAALLFREDPFFAEGRGYGSGHALRGLVIR